MVFSVEVWTFPTDDDEEPCREEVIDTQEFAAEEAAMRWAWERLEEGFFVRMYRR